jgi:polyisoprenoid-binding protein YceI
MRTEGTRVTAIVDGDLELAGQSRPASVHVELEPSQSGELQAHATARFRQSEWGIKPYTAFLGALKVADVVDVDAVATLRSG